MVRNLRGNTTKRVTNFVLLHPEFIPVVKILASAGNQWTTPRAVKLAAGLGTTQTCDDGANWVAFSTRCISCGLTESILDSNRHPHIRVLPGMNAEFEKILKAVEVE